MRASYVVGTPPPTTSLQACEMQLSLPSRVAQTHQPNTLNNASRTKQRRRGRQQQHWRVTLFLYHTHRRAARKEKKTGRNQEEKETTVDILGQHMKSDVRLSLSPSCVSLLTSAFDTPPANTLHAQQIISRIRTTTTGIPPLPGTRRRR